MTDESDAAGALGAQGVGSRQDRVYPEFVREWAREIIGTSYVPKARPEIETFLDECTQLLMASLTAPRFTTGPAASVGCRLVEAHFTGTAALERSLRVLASGLPTLLEHIEIDDHAGRVTALLSAFAAAFAEGLRDRTLSQQEVIKRAVLQARDAAEEALRASETRFRAVFTSSALGIAIAKLDGTIENANLAMAEIFRCTRAELVERSVFDLVDELWCRELRIAEADLAAGDLEQFQAETRFRISDGTEIWTQLSASLVRDAYGEPSYQVVLYEDITERHMLQEQLHRQATHDPLTGLANRTLLKTRMDTALEPTYPGRRVGLCYFDLDGFKAINDSLGHPVGDDLLRAVAHRLQALSRSEGALAARMGGDEFVVLSQDSQGATRMVEMVERMLREITRPVRIGGHELNASASVGVVEREVSRTEPDELLRDADITLYRAKDEGKAQWVLFEPEISEISRRRFKLSATMPSALDENQFFVEYRPITWLDGGALLAVEADPRWDHPEFGELDATDFLGLAEETGLITRLGNWMLDQVCSHAARWIDRLGPAAPDVAVSVSQRHFRDPELVGDLQRILRDTGMRGEKLWLMVPEAALFDDEDDPLDTVEIFDEMGLRLIVDDFGTHYSRLSRLRRLTVDAVKMTGPYLCGFGRQEGPDPVDQHVVSSLVDAARLLGVPLMAGGLDSARQAKRLHKMGVQAAEGAHIGGLASAMEIEAMIAGGNFRVG